MYSLPTWSTFLCLILMMFNGLHQDIGYEVIPIDTRRFKRELPLDSITLRWQNLMNLSCKEILNVWRYSGNSSELHGEYFDFGYLENNSKTGEFGPETKGGIRPAAQNAYTLSVALFTGAYQASMVGIPAREASEFSVAIIRSLAKDHVSNGGIIHPWGNQWQSAQWASKTAIAGWLMWDYLSVDDKRNISNMIAFEANRFLDLPAPAANENYKINTHAEEVGWDATGIQTACAMLPKHPNHQPWMDKLFEYRLTALASPKDRWSERIIEGRSISGSVNGYNIDSIGALGNHQAYPHPDYMAAPLRHTIEGALFFKLANFDVPEINSFNYSLVYDNFCNHVWNGISTIFVKDGTVYWPINIEEDRRFEYITFGLIDMGAQFLSNNPQNEKLGAYYEEKHTKKALEMQLTGFASASAYLWKWIHFQEK